jgi:hypothetical protein
LRDREHEHEVIEQFERRCTLLRADGVRTLKPVHRFDPGEGVSC